ncbi:hypothetical protein HDU91_001233 [Kappamyces sp. JEL0680]|nr:hypothetical protein HDU91_001233 [Kappamyces sp. JEL0680]
MLLNSRLHLYLLALFLGTLLMDAIFDVDILVGNTGPETVLRNHRHYTDTMQHWIPLYVFPILIFVLLVGVGVQQFYHRSRLSLFCSVFAILGGTVYAILEQGLEQTLPFLDPVKDYDQVAAMVKTAAYSHLLLIALLAVELVLLHIDYESYKKTHAARRKKRQ